MAKKETDEIKEKAEAEEKVEAEEKTPEKKTPGPEEFVEVTVMSDPSTTGQKLFCSVNGVAMYVPYNEPVKIKRKYAEVITNSLTQQRNAEKASLVSAREAREADELR